MDSTTGRSAASEQPTLDATRKPSAGITWALDALDNVSTVVIEEDDVPTPKAPPEPERPQIDVRELARRRGSDPFSGYNVADIYDHADAVVLGNRKRSFDPTTFKMYAPTMDVDALCSELLTFAGDMLATRVTHNPDSYQEDAYDDAEEQARIRLHRPGNRNTSTGPTRIASFRKPTNHAKFSREGLGLRSTSHDHAVSSSTTSFGESTTSGASARGSRATVVSPVEMNRDTHSTTSPLRPHSGGRSGAAGQGSVGERTSPSGDATATRLSPIGPEPVTSVGKKRLAMLLQGLRNGDFNAEFIQSVQQLRNPEDAVAAIGSYYSEGRDVVHKRTVAARRAKLKQAASETANVSHASNRARDVPRPSSGGPRRSIVARQSASLLAEEANRPGTPPSGEHERRKVLLRVLEQRRESEVRRINDKVGTNSALQRQRSLSRLKSLSGSTMNSFIRRRSSWMRANGEVTVSLGSLSLRWKRRLLASGSTSPQVGSPSPQRPPTASERGEESLETSVPAAISRHPPDVCLLFFRHASNRTLTVMDILNSTARFLGTLSYVYFFPSQSSLEMSLPNADKGGSRRDTTSQTSFSAEEASAWCCAIAKEIAGDSTAAADETEGQRSERVQQLLFPMVHHRIRTMLTENTLADSSKGSAGILFFSAMSKFGSGAEFFETTNGRRVVVSRDDVPTCLNEFSMVSSTSDDDRFVRSPTKWSHAGGSSHDQLWEAGSPTARGGGGGFGDKRMSRAAGDAGGRGTTARPVFLDPPAPEGSPSSGPIRRGGRTERNSDPEGDNSVVALSDILGVAEHRRRISEHSKSVLKYPAHAPPAFVMGPPASILERALLVPKTPTQSNSCRPGIPWSSIFAREELFPPPGLDVAYGVREGHIPRTFESISPRSTGGQQPLRWYHGCTTPSSSARTASRSSRATMPSRDGGASVCSRIMSPSGHAIHKFQRLPQKVLMTSRRDGSPTLTACERATLTASERGDLSAGLFPLLMTPNSPPLPPCRHRGSGGVSLQHDSLPKFPVNHAAPAMSAEISSQPNGVFQQAELDGGPVEPVHYQPFLQLAEASYSDGLLPILASTLPHGGTPRTPRRPAGCDDEADGLLASVLQSRRLRTSRVTAR